MALELTIEKRSHHFLLKNFSRRVKDIIDSFSRKYILWGYIREGRNSRRAPLKVFAAATYDRSEYRFHINCYREFIVFLHNSGVTENQYSVSVREVKPSVKVDIPVKEGWVPRENQLAPVAYIEDPKPVSKLVCLYTGGGKSFISMYGTAKIKNRFILVARPMYLDKWVIDVKKTYDIKEDEILYIQGSASLMALMEKARNNDLPEKAILISNKTMHNYLANYEKYGEDIKNLGYDCLPDDLFEALGGGIRVIDEVHQDFHFNFKLDLYTHTERSVSLSATLITDDPFIEQMHNLAYPPNERYEGAEYVPYINTNAVLFQFHKPQKIRSTDFSGKTYSHHAFEKSIMKDPVVLKNYLNLIGDQVDEYYVRRKDRKDGDKFIVFLASIDLCTIVTKYLRDRFQQFSIERYVEDDPYSNLMEPDGRVSTLLSAGTAVDIPQLSTSILCTGVKSSVSNVQGFGRLRMMDDGRNPTFVYLTSRDINKQIEYHEKKREIIIPRSKSFREINYGQLI